jgi:hypothetical protein
MRRCKSNSEVFLFILFSPSCLISKRCDALSSGWRRRAKRRDEEIERNKQGNTFISA